MRIEKGEAKHGDNRRFEGQRPCFASGKDTGRNRSFERQSPVNKQKQSTSSCYKLQQEGKLFDECTKASDTSNDQDSISQSAQEAQNKYVLAFEPLPQNKGILCANGYNERCAEQKPGYRSRVQQYALPGLRKPARKPFHCFFHMLHGTGKRQAQVPVAAIFIKVSPR